jgi:hypothetical protein
MQVSSEKLAGLFVFLLFSISQVSAQSRKSAYELGVHIGTFIYQGDLTPTAVGSFNTAAFSVGINAKKKLSNNVSLRMEVNTGGLKGDDSKYVHPAWRQQRNLRFNARVTEVVGMLVWSPFETDQRLSPYFFGGIGYSLLRIKRDYSDYNAEYFAAETVTERLATDISRSVPRSVPIIPMGIGLRYPLTTALSVNTEVSFRYMNSDYLDGFSEAGNPDKKDYYYLFSLGINYSLLRNNNLKCPVIWF